MTWGERREIKRHKMSMVHRLDHLGAPRSVLHSLLRNQGPKIQIKNHVTANPSSLHLNRFHSPFRSPGHRLPDSDSTPVTCPQGVRSKCHFPCIAVLPSPRPCPPIPFWLWEGSKYMSALPSPPAPPLIRSQHLRRHLVLGRLHG